MTTLEDWVDSVLDYYETRTWGRYDPWEKSWEKNIYGRFPLPPVIDLNHADFDPQALQDAMMWLHDGGLKPREVASVLHLPKKGIGKALEKLAVEYSDDA